MAILPYMILDISVDFLIDGVQSLIIIVFNLGNFKGGGGHFQFSFEFRRK